MFHVMLIMRFNKTPVPSAELQVRRLQTSSSALDSGEASANDVWPSQSYDVGTKCMHKELCNNADVVRLQLLIWIESKSVLMMSQIEGNWR